MKNRGKQGKNRYFGGSFLEMCRKSLISDDFVSRTVWMGQTGPAEPFFVKNQFHRGKRALFVKSG